MTTITIHNADCLHFVGADEKSVADARRVRQMLEHCIERYGNTNHSVDIRLRKPEGDWLEFGVNAMGMHIGCIQRKPYADYEYHS